MSFHRAYLLQITGDGAEHGSRDDEREFALFKDWMYTRSNSCGVIIFIRSHEFLQARASRLVYSCKACTCSGSSSTTTRLALPITSQSKSAVDKPRRAAFRR